MRSRWTALERGVGVVVTVESVRVRDVSQWSNDRRAADLTRIVQGGRG